MNGKFVISAFLCTLFFCFTGSANSAFADSTPILTQGFEKGLDGWISVGPSSSVKLTTDVAFVKEGTHALEFDYTVKKGDVNILVCPNAGVNLAGAKSIQFWLYSDYTTPMAFALQETGGARYMAVFMAEKKRWQRITLSVSDFILSTNKGDPPDPDGKLDMDQIAGMGIIDLGDFFAQMDTPEVRKFFTVVPGDHTLYLDGLTISSDALPMAIGSGDKGYVVDNFARPQAMWLPLGGMQLTPMDGDKTIARYMRVVYQQAPGIPSGIMRNLSPGSLSGATSIDFDVASKTALTLLIQLEQTDGSKFYASTDVVGDGQFHHVSVSMDDFHVSNDSANANATLNTKLVKNLYFIDPSGLVNNSDQPNVLMLANIIALKSK